MNAPAQRALLLTVGLALFVAGLWIVRLTSPAPAVAPGDALVLPLPDAPPSRSVDRTPDEPSPADLERRPTRPPAPPGPRSDVEALWSYGETHLGWAPAADVDLSELTPEQLTAWVEQDLRLYGHREPGGLGYVLYLDLDRY